MATPLAYVGNAPADWMRVAFVVVVVVATLFAAVVVIAAAVVLLLAAVVVAHARRLEELRLRG